MEAICFVKEASFDGVDCVGGDAAATGTVSLSPFEAYSISDHPVSGEAFLILPFFVYSVVRVYCVPARSRQDVGLASTERPGITRIVEVLTAHAVVSGKARTRGIEQTCAFRSTFSTGCRSVVLRGGKLKVLWGGTR